MFLSRKLLRCSHALSLSHTLYLSPSVSFSKTLSPSLVAYRGYVNYYEVSVRFQVQFAMKKVENRFSVRNAFILVLQGTQTLFYLILMSLLLSSVLLRRTGSCTGLQTRYSPVLCIN